MNQIVGNDRAVRALASWADGWDSEGRSVPPKPAALLEGPPGSGKTAAALALASERGWSTVEMSASDTRNERSIDEVAGRAALSHSLDAQSWRPGARHRALILFDEADCWSGRVATSAKRVLEWPVLREFLRSRYGTIGALNEAWKLGGNGRPKAFGKWENIPASVGGAAWVALPEARVDLDDWRGGQRSEDVSDRGGLAAIVRLLRLTRQPIVLTANDGRVLTRFSQAFSSLAQRIRFGPVEPVALKNYLRRVAVEEGMSIDPTTFDAILRRSRGDVRAALNDLEIVAPLPAGPLQRSVVGARDQVSDFEGLTWEVFEKPRLFRAGEIRDRLDATPDDLFPWIEENLPRFRREPSARVRGFEELEKVDLLLNRARRERVYALWSFASELMTGGVGVSSGGVASSIETPAFPSFVADMGRSRMVRALRDGIVRKAGRHLHLSKRKATETYFPILEGLFRTAGPHPARGSAGALRRALSSEFEFSDEELGFLLGREPSSAAVRELRIGGDEEVNSVGRKASRPKKEVREEVRDAGKTPQDPFASRSQKRLGDY